MKFQLKTTVLESNVKAKTEMEMLDVEIATEEEPVTEEVTVTDLIVKFESTEGGSLDVEIGTEVEAKTEVSVTDLIVKFESNTIVGPKCEIEPDMETKYETIVTKKITNESEEKVKDENTESLETKKDCVIS